MSELVHRGQITDVWAAPTPLSHFVWPLTAFFLNTQMKFSNLKCSEKNLGEDINPYLATISAADESGGLAVSATPGIRNLFSV